jgi:hypothetical protein
MTDIATHSSPGAATAMAVQDVVEAGHWVIAVKRTNSAARIAQAERALQAAVDNARDQQVPWGEIGSALGIARGNAYQRYRKRLSLGASQGGSEVETAFRNPCL